MNHPLIRRTAVELGRLSLLAPVLLVAVALLVAACNNGSGGTGY